MSKRFATVSSLCKTRRPLCVTNCNIQSVTPKCTPLSHLVASFKCGSTNTEKLKPYPLLATCLQRASTLSLDVRAPLMGSLAGRRRTQRLPGQISENSANLSIGRFSHKRCTKKSSCYHKHNFRVINTFIALTVT